MKAFVVTPNGAEVVFDAPVPIPGESDALVRVLRAGICATDLQLLQGYKGGFRGVLGHEFVGEVVKAEASPDLVGKRVCGELNISCASCALCHRGGTRARNHCLRRRVLGILNHGGTYAEYLTLPISNLHVVPDSISNEAAVFVEPLAAACRIVEQGLVREGDRVCILGDGKLGLLIAEVLARHGKGERPVVIGRHAEKMTLLGSEVEARCIDATQGAQLPEELAGAFDVVVEATGTPSGLELAAQLAVPMGTVVLKSTCASAATIDTSRLVVSELNVVGSRCGPFPEAIALLTEKGLDPTKYTSAVFALDKAEEALAMAGSRGCMKVQLAIAESEMSAIGVRKEVLAA